MSLNVICYNSGHFSGTKIQLIHPLASLLSHDCNPNVMKYFGGISEGNHLQCKAAVDIQMGQKLTVSYIDLLIPSIIRQKILNEVNTFLLLYICTTTPSLKIKGLCWMK